jgi:hypothetical protein
MRQTISGLVAAIAVMSAAPAMACGGGLFGAYASPCAQPEVYVAPVEPAYTGCGPCGGWAYERLSDPAPYYPGRVHQYYYVNQGPTYTGPGDFAPYPTYREGGYRIHPHFRAWRHTGYRYRYGYATHHGYAPRYGLPPRAFYGHHMRYGAHMGAPRAYSYHEHMMHEHMMRHYN